MNKLLGGVQAVVVWASDDGYVPDDQSWSDPFARMRLEEAEPDREPWNVDELNVLFSSPVFSLGERPREGRGEAAFWLPILALYTGARLGELAPLTASNIRLDEGTGIPFIEITEDEERGASLKTRSSRRIVPIHPQLKALGFLELVASRREEGDRTQLFPLLEPGPHGGFGEAWSKWFHRYIRSIGIENKDRVFHSFRHTFKDALRGAGVSEDVHDALTGHSGGGVGRRYGAKDMQRRFGLRALSDAVSKAEYPGLSLEHLRSD